MFGPSLLAAGGAQDDGPNGVPQHRQNVVEHDLVRAYRPLHESAILAAEVNRRQRVCGLIGFMLCVILILLTSILA